ncbi:MAG: cytosine permease [Lachnospiraceae bacterium]
MAILVLGMNIWTTNDNALYSAGLGLANIFGQKKKPMVLISGAIGTILSVWLYYNFCDWLNILNCTLPPVGIILVLSYFMNRKEYEEDKVKIVTVNWFAVAGVVLGAIVANVVPAGIASINGMAVAALCYVIGELKNRKCEIPCLPDERAGIFGKKGKIWHCMRWEICISLFLWISPWIFLIPSGRITRRRSRNTGEKRSRRRIRSSSPETIPGEEM